MDSGNWTNFLIKWKSNIEMPNPLKSEKKNYTQKRNDIKPNHWAWVCPAEFVSQNWTICFPTIYMYKIHIYSPADANLNDDDWIQSSMRKFDMHEIFTFQYEFLIENHLIKISIFGILSVFICELQQQPKLWRPATSTDWRKCKHVSVLRICTIFFLECSLQLAAVCLIIPYKQYCWCIFLVN